MNPLNTSFISQEYNTVLNPKALIIFAHGAGADMKHEFMENFTTLLNKAQFNVLRFNFPYMDKRAETGKRYPPDRMPKLIDCYLSVVKKALQAENMNDLPLFVAGKSMGSRVAVTIAGLDEISNTKAIRGVFCLGYPFHPQKKPEKLRLEPLQKTKKPVLIIQGDRDALGNKDEIDNYDLSPLCQCSFLADGDHNLKPRVKSGYNHQQHLQSAINSITEFIHEYSE